MESSQNKRATQERPKTRSEPALKSRKVRESTILNILLFLSVVSLVAGWLIMNSVSTLGHTDFSGGSRVNVYANSLLGFGIMMAAIIVFSASISYRFTTSIERGTFIFLEVTGLFLLAFGLWIISCGTVNAWVDIPYGAQSYVSIDPTSFLFGLLFTGPGILAVTYGLVQIRKWFAKSIE